MAFSFCAEWLWRSEGMRDCDWGEEMMCVRGRGGRLGGGGW